METMSADAENDQMDVYYAFEDTLTYKTFTLDFHPAFILFHKILILLEEYDRKNGTQTGDKDKMLVLGVASNNFDALDKEHFVNNHNDVYDLTVPQKGSKFRRIVVKILTKLGQMKDPKSSVGSFKSPDSSSIGKSGSKGLKKYVQKSGLTKINEDEVYKEYDHSEEERERERSNPDRMQRNHILNKLDDYSSREKLLGSGQKVSSKVESLKRGKLSNVQAPRGRDLFFSYNTQYGGGFLNFKQTKLGQYQQAYNRIEDKLPKKKQTASSLQRIEPGNPVGQLSTYNKISANFSKNEFASSVYDFDSSDN